MNLSKSYEFFQPETVRERIHIIGCGAIGSTLAENLARYGLTKISLYDFDHVEDKNIANQMYRHPDIGKMKVDALADYLIDINPDIKRDLKLVPEGYQEQTLSGYVFLAVDSIETRRRIAEKFNGNRFVKAMFDFRMGLLEAQHFAADWGDQKQVDNFIGSMQFTDEEANAATPVSACNQVLSVCTTVRRIVAEGVDNFIQYVKGDSNLKNMILVGENHFCQAIPE